ncbi:MAG: AI-2E family transporter [Candidatus Nanohalobium sp.]
MNRQKSFLFLSIALVLLVCFAMVLPFLGYLLAGLMLAFILEPVKSRLENFTGPGISSALVVVMTVLGAVLPVLALTGFVAGDASELVSTIERDGLDLSNLETQVEKLTGLQVSLEDRVQSAVKTIGSTVLSGTSRIVGFASRVSIGISLMLFTQFYGLKEGRKLVEWTEGFDVMPTEVQRDLYNRTARTMDAVVKGHIFVAVASAAIAGIGLFLTGIPNAAFWTFVMVLTGLIPMVGTALVWLPATVYLLIQGSLPAAAFLFTWGVVVVGGSDNFLRPFLVDPEADLHPLYIILGVIGGAGVFGVIGIFVGPVMFGLAKSLLTIYRENLDMFDTR